MHKLIWTAVGVDYAVSKNMTDDEIGFLDQFVKLRYRAHRRFIGPLSNSTIQIKKLIGILVE